MRKQLILLQLIIFGTVFGLGAQEIATTKGIGPETGIVRRDPSDVIKVGKKYYVYYTKMVHEAELIRAKKLNLRFVYPEGYHGDVYGAVSEDKGHTWSELGPMVKRGPQGSFNSNSCFTPNILSYKGKYYLYYTAVGDGFDNLEFEDKNRTVIGLAVADNPEGPFRKLDKPVMESTRDNKSFDSYRVDDAALRVINGKIWMYYKGRCWKNAKPNTMIGLAIANRPEGPYKRANNGEPVQTSGHEVLVWEYGKNVFSFVHHGHGENSGTIRMAKDGMSFDAESAIVSKAPKLHAPGLYRPELTGKKVGKDPIRWGVEMLRGREISLKRFELDMRKVMNIK